MGSINGNLALAIDQPGEADNDNFRAVSLHRGCCLDVLPTIPDGAVNLVIADLPYGVTRCQWDSKIDLVAFWREVRRVLRNPSGSVIMFGTQPFASELVMSNRDWFKYSLVWQKNHPTMFQHCWQRFLSAHEDILVFSPGVVIGKYRSQRQMTFNPQGVIKLEQPRKRKAEQRIGFLGKTYLKGGEQTHTNFPRSVLQFNSEAKTVHPTQKPVDLLAYLIRTFSNPGDVVFDPTMGVGSTGVAAVQEGREFVGVEIDPEFYAKAFERIME